MLSLYQSFDVPDVPNVKIYRDDEKSHKFYMVSERATIARDDEGDPLFTFILYARDVDRLDPADREVERGYLALTTQAAVSKEAEEKIRAYLRTKLNEERNRGFRWLGLRINQTEPELGYPPLWLDGTVEFRALGPDMVPYSAGSKEPSLIDTNVASFSAMLTQDGAELFRQAVEKRIVPAGIWYTLTFAARIPAIRIHIYGNRGDFYNEVKNYVRHRWEYVRRTEFFGITLSERHWVREWTELASITKFRNTFHALTIDVDDSSLPESERDEMRDKLEEMAFEVLQSNILPSFFETAIQDVAAEENTGTGIPVNTITTGSIDVLINRSEIVKKKINPNAQLAQALTPEEVKAHTIYIDLSQPYFQELDVRVNANVNFTADPVYGLKVFLDYDQQDDRRHVRVKKAKEFLFKNADHVGRFRQIMATGADGAPKDSYRYWSEIIYRDTGETIRVPRAGTTEARERELVISYRRLGFVKVNLILGSMPETVTATQVTMRYPGYSGPSGQQTLELTPEKPTATFFTYTGRSGEPGPYRYQITYLLADGQRVEEAEQSGQAETLTIQSPFELATTTRFLVQADFSVVQKVLVDAGYRDPANDYAVDHHAEFFENGETSVWSFGLRDPNQREFTYNETIIYRNGSRRDIPAKTGQLGRTIPVGEGAVDALDVLVIASTVDWSTYRLVVVSLEYDDDNKTNFIFRPDEHDDREWHVLLSDGQPKSYRYRVRYVGVEGHDSRETAPTTTDETVLVIE